MIEHRTSVATSVLDFCNLLASANLKKNNLQKPSKNSGRSAAYLNLSYSSSSPEPSRLARPLAQMLTGCTQCSGLLKVPEASSAVSTSCLSLRAAATHTKNGSVPGRVSSAHVNGTHQFDLIPGLRVLIRLLQQTDGDATFPCVPCTETV